MIGRLGFVVPLIVAVAIGASVAAAKDREWQTGTWRDIDVKRKTLDFGPGATSFDPPGRPGPSTMRAMADVRTYVIETDTLRLEVEDVVPVGRRSLDVSIGDRVTFAVDKKSVYVRDADGKEHKLRLTKRTAKT